MRRDFTRKSVAARRVARQRKWIRRISVLTAAITLAATGTSLLYYYQGGIALAFHEQSSGFQAWLAKHHENLNEQMLKVKQMAANKEPPAIHFEFYDELSNLQVANPKPEIVTLSTAAPLPQAIAVVDAKQFEAEFSKQIKANNFIVQVAMFKNLQSAQKLSKDLLSSGLSAKVITLGSAEKPLYRVQLGPFEDKMQAALSQKQLQKKGLNSILRNINN